MINRNLDESIFEDYGGAFDIDPTQFFTKEDLVEFGNAVQDAIKYTASNQDMYDISDIDLNNNELSITVIRKQDQEEFTFKTKIDMRKIRLPSDLESKYLPIVKEGLQKEIKSSIY